MHPYAHQFASDPVSHPCRYAAGTATADAGSGWSYNRADMKAKQTMVHHPKTPRMQ